MQVLPYGLPGHAECGGYFAAVETSHDAFHNLTLGSRQAAQHLRDPLRVFPCCQLTILGAFFVRDMASFDKAPRYPLRPSPLVLNEVVDHGRGRVCEGPFAWRW